MEITIEMFRTRARTVNKTARARGAKGWVKARQLRRIAEHQYWICPYCGQDVRECWSVDHIVPVSKGGMNTWENIQITCDHCNIQKADQLDWKGGEQL